MLSKIKTKERTWRSLFDFRIKLLFVHFSFGRKVDRKETRTRMKMLGQMRRSSLKFLAEVWRNFLTLITCISPTHFIVCGGNTECNSLAIFWGFAKV
jgi:hypothetical protein